MKISKYIHALIVVLLYPYIVSFRPDGADTSWTEVRIALGNGSFTEFTRDCNGNIVGATKIPVTDFSAGVRHEEEHYRYGVHAGYLSLGSATEKRFDRYGGYSEGRTISSEKGWYLTPTAGVHWKYFGLDVGGCMTNWNSNSAMVIPSGTLRIGNREGLFLSTSLLNNMPLATGGGFFDVGLGYNSRRTGSGFWMGMCMGPTIESPQLSLKYDVLVINTMFLNFRAQFADRDLGYTDHALSIGGGIIF
ncbi:MAG: hypothetical protein HYV29_15665 [Ignavibacteriales bacterium]|nr:hypothetical protein [Ignavibacteriales bacterium]